MCTRSRPLCTHFFLVLSVSVFPFSSKLLSSPGETSLYFKFSCASTDVLEDFPFFFLFSAQRSARAYYRTFLSFFLPPTLNRMDFRVFFVRPLPITRQFAFFFPSWDHEQVLPFFPFPRGEGLLWLVPSLSGSTGVSHHPLPVQLLKGLLLLFFFFFIVGEEVFTSPFPLIFFKEGRQPPFSAISTLFLGEEWYTMLPQIDAFFSLQGGAFPSFFSPPPPFVRSKHKPPPRALRRMSYFSLFAP